VSLKRLIVLALLAATIGAAGDVGVGARASELASCGRATTFKGAPILQFGPVRIAGFSSARCAWITLGCAKLGGYQSNLSLELAQAPASPIVLRAAPSDNVKFSLVGSMTPAPKIPHCVSARTARAQVSLKAPDMYYVLFVFAPRGSVFHLTALRAGHQLGTAVIVCRA
jgi:hypothetical protein